MNTYEPLQRLSDSRWDYTRNGKATGYCQAFEPFSDEFVKRFHISQTEIDKHNAHKDKYHADGHETKEECLECYKEYLLDHRLRLNGQDASRQCKCEVCGEWTQRFADLGSQILYLCDAHHSREEVAKIFTAPEWSSASW